MKSIYNKIFSGLLSDRAVPLQKKMLEEWLAASDKNIEIYYKWVEESENKNPVYMPDTEKIYTRLQSRLHPRSTGEKRKTIEQAVTKESRWFSLSVIKVSVTAVLLTFLLVGFFWDTVVYKTYRTNYGETKEILLADGTKVNLHSNSLLRLPRYHAGKTRPSVFLFGEADFGVVHTPDHQHFVVKMANHLDIEVLGTDFFVYSRSRGSNIVLKKGKIKIHYQKENKNQSLIVHPGDTVTFNQTNDILTKPLLTIPGTQANWKNTKFIFNETTLLEIARIIEETYEVKVQFDKGLKYDKKLMGKIEAGSLPEFLDIVSRLLHIRYEIRDHQIRFF